MSAAKLILLGLAVISVLVIAAAVFWVKYYAKDFAKETGKSAQITMAEGTRYGTTTNIDGCLKKATESVSSCGIVSIKCEVDAHLFLDGCVAATPDVQARCAVLRENDGTLARVAWGLETCQSLGHGGEQRCQRLVDVLPRYCERLSQRAAPAR